MPPDAARLTPREKSRRDTEAAVLEIANRQLDSEGPHGLSLRAVARELGVVSSAVYRYVRSRDELLTLLITDAYEGLADDVEAALAREGDTLEVLAVTMLHWSRRFPQRWALIHGSPVEGYRAPEETVPPGTRTAVQAARLVAELHDQTPHRQLSDAAGSHPAATWLVGELEELGLTISPQAALRAVSVWAGLLGMVNILRFGQLGPGSADVEDDLMRAHVLRLTT
ncbi:TetR/AcrR family transcriptional regulator [Nesterenkonia xinjiangensis]|uniref:AcrR family transcriptional regulator n=1 Tax=Nesterenkonia xinjiangensis TaxID=225327 RepID=A0A7Z0KBL3_9MICC|nr:TetR/AcrR family transcriptional regulator [Nesterenkonia xinjiangensis]NYJ77737.1 AcrR family transcriptional regulator [Nesterenkonia xinjiangensis]